MKKYILVLLIGIAVVAPFFMFKDRFPLLAQSDKQKLVCSIDLKACQENILNYLKVRKDNLALIEIDKVLSVVPDDICALWGRAEVLRREYKFKESENLLKQVLSKCPDHAPSLISLSYINYHDNKFEEALRLLKQTLKQPSLERENKALVYVLVGSINAKKLSSGGFFSKIAYGIRVRGFFEKARTIAPDLSEVRLGLGSFYLLAPRIAGGDIDRAIKELECAVNLAPDFATANIRLAQCYRKKGNLEKYNFYIQRAKDLDPDNEVLHEEFRD